MRRVCCEEIEQTRQAKKEELSMQQRRNPATVSRSVAQIQDLQNKVNSLSDAREFYESGSSSGATHVPDQTSTILSSRKFRAAIMDCRELHIICGCWGNVFERHRSRETLYNLQQFKEFRITSQNVDLMCQRQQGEM